MDTVLRAVSVYLVLLFLFRIAGRRTLSEVTTFNFVLLLIIGESTQQALIGEDFSITTAVILIATLIAMELGMSLVKEKSRRLDRVIDGTPLVIVEHGRLLHERLRESQVDEEDILHAAREGQGLERLDQIRYAVLERSGGISIIPEKEGG